MRTYHYKEMRGDVVLREGDRPVEVVLRVALKKVRVALEKGGLKDAQALDQALTADGFTVISEID